MINVGRQGAGEKAIEVESKVQVNSNQSHKSVREKLREELQGKLERGPRDVGR